MKIGVSMWSYFHVWRKGGFDVPAFVREAKSAGADGVELLDFFYNEPNTDRRSSFDEDYLAPIRAGIRQALDETGLPVPIFSIAQNFAKPDAEDRKLELGKITFGVDEALRYGAGVVRVFAGDVADGITFDQARAWIVEGLIEASKYAADHGVKLALENHGTLAGRGDQVRGLIDDVRAGSGVDALGANPDTGNFILVNQASDEAIRQVASIANMVHFKDFVLEPEGHEGFAYTALDGRRYVGMAVGEGEVNLGSCIQALKDGGFDGWLSVEYEGEEDPITAVPRSIQNARKFL
jgi:sugar phosphate isomerase/epimerase